MHPIHIVSGAFHPRTWAGGITTELFIFPPDASYVERTFHFRLSTATVEVERSEFTSLPGVSRHLMVLSGQILLKHEGHHQRDLSVLEVDSFEGDWKTTGYGRCSDFNVMTTGGRQAILTGMALASSESVTVSPQIKAGWLFLYAFSGQAVVMCDGQEWVLSKGDLLVFQNPGDVPIALKAQPQCLVAMAEVQP